MEQFSKQILFASLEDYPPLSEIIWEVNSLTDTKNYANYELAFNSVRELFEHGYIQLYQSDGFQGELQLIDDYDEVFSLLKDPKSWEPKAYNESMIRIGEPEAVSFQHILSVKKKILSEKSKDLSIWLTPYSYSEDLYNKYFVKYVDTALRTKQWDHLYYIIQACSDKSRNHPTGKINKQACSKAVNFVCTESSKERCKELKKSIK
jgi:hypothetical protein